MRLFVLVLLCAGLAIAAEQQQGQIQISQTDVQRYLKLEGAYPVVEDAKPATGEPLKLADSGRKTADELATYLKKACESENEHHINDFMHGILHTLHVTNKHGKLAGAFAKHTDLLTTLQPAQVVDDVLKCNKQNDYMMAAVAKLAESEDVRKEMADTFGTRSKELCFAVVYAGMLERLTNLALHDYQLIEHFLALSKELRGHKLYHERVSKAEGAFVYIKQISVESVFKLIFLPALKRAQYNVKKPAGGIFGNIIEAVAQDTVDKYPDNAAAGMPLARACTKPIQTSTRGSGTDKQVDLQWPATEKWDNLYQSWNMAFCSRFPQWPMLFGKLLNPAVSCYHDRPSGYLYRRGIALEIHINFGVSSLLFDTYNFFKQPWSDTARKIFGAQNKESSVDYQAAAEEALKLDKGANPFREKAKAFKEFLRLHTAQMLGRF